MEEDGLGQEKPTSNMGQQEKTCRICLDGEDPTLGRLIKPCLCTGSISYVHVKCLQRWRTQSTGDSAFYRCPQCRFHYRFARTKVLGLATNPVPSSVPLGRCTKYIVSPGKSRSVFFFMQKMSYWKCTDLSC
ncbi:hypothetical protein ID866_6584, partial [Astraeus odoratus]